MKKMSYLPSGLRSPSGSSVTVQALLHTQDVAPVAVEVQHVGVKVADLKLHHFQNSFLPTREASSARSGSMAV